MVLERARRADKGAIVGMRRSGRVPLPVCAGVFGGGDALVGCASAREPRGVEGAERGSPLRCMAENVESGP